MTQGHQKKAPKRLAVLGGGIASLSAAFQLTQEANWKEKYEITLYQMGWRLGGKGASGRNPEIADRIEEHGLHVWFGCYDNAFSLLRACYEELGRPVGSPLATLEEAFEPAHSFVGMEKIGEEWIKWPIGFPSNEKQPGTKEELPSAWGYISMMLKQMMEGVIGAHIKNAFGTLPFEPEEQKWFRDLFEDFLTFFSQFLKFAGVKLSNLSIYDFVEYMEGALAEIEANRNFSFLVFGLEKMKDWMWKECKEKVKESHNIRRTWIMFDLITANILGMIKDGVVENGFEVIDNMDYREWVAKHAMTPELTADCSVVQAFYSVIFAGHKQHSFEAGTALKGALRIAFTYKGAYFYRMNAGMGDVVFTPLYEVLKRRGVKFRFFHKVKNLGLGPDNTINRIEIDRQASPIEKEYKPLYTVKGLACWPSVPLYDSLVEGDELRKRKVNLESEWSDWEPVERISLKLGQDFDEVLLGISVAGLKKTCLELIAANPAWKAMVENIATTPTQAVQLWLKPNIEGLGWPYRHQGRPLAGTFQQPLDTNADLSNLIQRENWPPEAQPGHIAYLCGKLNVDPVAGEKDPDFPAKVLEQVHQNAKRYLENLSFHFWPKAQNTDGSFRWSLLNSLDPIAGPNNLKSQYLRANIDPSELYVLSEAGSSAYRLKQDASGFSNLFLTGDWTDTGFNVGCIEAAVMSGLQGARAVSGEKYEVLGETYPPLGDPDQESPAAKIKVARYQSALFSLYKMFLM